MQAEGYAIVTEGKINVATVSPTERGAKVNWLYTVAHIRITNAYSDDDIEQLWRVHSGDAKCLLVTIAVRQ